jgi:hypothetical protein
MLYYSINEHVTEWYNQLFIICIVIIIILCLSGHLAVDAAHKNKELNCIAQK